MLLIIDSEKIADIKIKHCFQEFGFQEIEIVKTATAALEFLAQHKKISMIIINGKLDDGDGYKLCQEIRCTEAGRDAFIYIIVSSVENKTAIEKAHRCGANDYVVKPYDSDVFKKKFTEFTQARVVLLVEDDPVIRMTVESILSKYKVEIISVDDGVEAHNLLNTMMPVKLVLLDIGLPNMSGLQLIKQIRSKPGWKKTAVVMLTGSTEAVDVKTSLSSGANDYIAKPFKVENFVNRLQRYLPDAS